MGIVDIALSQVGIAEQGVNEVKYNDWYYGRHVSGGSYPWCAAFVSWCANQAGVSESIIPKTASVSTLYSFFVSHNLFQRKGNGYRPKAGDILIQKSGGASHTGIVYASDDSKFYTIEGNSGKGAVNKRTYSYDDSKLTGFGTPNYSGSPSTGTIPVSSDDNTGFGSASGSSLGVGRYDYTAYTVKKDDTVPSVSKKFNITPAMLMFVNNLDSPNLTPGQVLQVPTPSQVLSPTEVNTGVGTITKRHTQQITVSHPTIAIEFYGEYGKLASVSTTGLTADKDVDNEIISVNTVRNMSQDCPTFTISLVWRNKWFTNLASNDLIVIKMQRPPEAKVTVFLGLIDDIRKAIDFSSGHPQRAVQVTGRGFNKAFVNFDVGLIENVSVDLGTGFFANLTQLSGCDSYNAIQIIWDSYVGRAVKYSFGNDKNFEDYATYDGNVHENEVLVDYESYTNYSGSLWNFIKEVSNAPFNETYWEIKNEKPHMFHRRTPFNKEDWIALPRITIKDCDIVSDNTGRSDLETYTVYSVQQSLMGEEYTNVFPPLWYPPYYAKYGISQLQIHTVYESNTSDTQEAIKSYTNDLFNFNIKNNVFSNGTLVVKGKAAYKVGERVIIESENMEYYVESVSHSFNCYGNWTTTLGVTRGIEPENRFTVPWGCAEELTAQVMNAMILQTSGQEIDWHNLPEISGSSEGYAGSSGDGYVDGQFTWPVPGHTTITSPFGKRNAPTYGATSFHKGIDIGAPLGTPIVAAASGKVINSGPASGYGNWIKIDHGNGLTTTYGHMKTLYAKVGQIVSAGDRIALVGSEGVSTGPHLHFQVEVNGSAVNPTPYFTKKSGTGKGTNGTASENEKAVYNYLKTKAGLNTAAACAVLGNINAESSFKTKCDGDGGTSYGLCQWHNDRKHNLIMFCKSNGYDLQSVEGQMAFMVKELKESYPGVWSNLNSCPNTAQGAYNSGYYFCVNYEVPANKQTKGHERGTTARTVFFPRYS